MDGRARWRQKSGTSPSGFKGENGEVLKIINDIFEATGDKGIVIYDRGSCTSWSSRASASSR